MYVIGLAKDRDADDNFVTDNVNCQVAVFSLDKIKWSTLSRHQITLHSLQSSMATSP